MRNINIHRRIRVGMLGGGVGAFIGNIHRIAMRISDRYELVAACFSSDHQRNLQSAEEIGLDSGRLYFDFESMARAEAAHPAGIEAVIIVTPNHLHFEMVKCFLKHGIHVICDKPLTTDLSQCRELLAVSRLTNKQVYVTYNYSAYPMVREARDRFSQGQIGELRYLKVEYLQDWLANRIEDHGHKQASWRVDPSLAGRVGCLGDIGIHAYNLACFITQKQAAMLTADLVPFVADRRLDDHAQVMLRYASGARGILLASQVAHGCENRLSIQIIGERGSLEWFQEQPNQLHLHLHGQATQILSRARPTNNTAQQLSLLPAGHPEGYLEAFAVLYNDIANCIVHGGSDSTTPTVDTALGDMQFIEACIESSQNQSAWVWY